MALLHPSGGDETMRREARGRGLTNREIAQSLTVTPKRVETHLRHVYRKLDREAGRAGGRARRGLTLGHRSRWRTVRATSLA